MKKSARIYLRKEKYIVTPFSRTMQGLYVITEPILVYEELPDLIKNLDFILECSKTDISIEGGERISDIALKNLFKAVGVRSYTAYVKLVTKSVRVTEENGSVSFTPTRKEGKGFSYFSDEEEKIEKAPLSDQQALIDALTKALANCQ